MSALVSSSPSLWARLSSLFSAHPTVTAADDNARIIAPKSPAEAPAGGATSLRFGFFSLFSPLSAGSLLVSLIANSSKLFSSSVFSSSRKASITAAAPSTPLSPAESLQSAPTPVLLASPNASVQAPSPAPSPAPMTSLFPQIILDVRLTASSGSTVGVQTATPCATDSAASLYQIHNAGGELVGYELSDPRMMQASSYMLQFAPQQVQFGQQQVQQQPQQFMQSTPPAVIPLEQSVSQYMSAGMPQQFPAIPAVTVNDAEQGDFLDKLNELEVYIAEMRSKLNVPSRSLSSDEAAMPMGMNMNMAAPNAVSPANRVVRRRNERQSVVSPYPRVAHPVGGPVSVEHNTVYAADAPAGDMSNSFLSPDAFSTAMSTSAPSSTYSPSMSNTWSPPENDDLSPASFSIDDSYSFTGHGFKDSVDNYDGSLVAPQQDFSNMEAFGNLENSSVLKEELEEDDGQRFMPVADVPYLQANGMPFQLPLSSMPPQFQHPMFMSGPQYAEQLAAFEAHAFPYVPKQELAPASDTSSPRSSMSSPQTLSSGASPVSSNSSPSSSPGKKHAHMMMLSSSPCSATMNEDSPDSSLGSAQPTFQCPHCPSKFRIKGYLTRHLKKHAINKAYTCPFFDPTSSTPCHSTGGFSRRDTYKTHLKSRHFVYPAGTRSDQRSGMHGWCSACGMPFQCNENWVENHVEGGECRAFNPMALYV
ncbi:uncharacterized protein V1518DRAFT_442246 [Limtongia smithiae]|uniref:uncharacterized protein n=1 Tax=Limtongia smithiae TaxID=1125753 RepID=UPI0034CF532F